MPYLNCLNCDKKFYARPYNIALGFGKYCSKRCSNIYSNPALSQRVPQEIEQAIIQAYQSGKSKQDAGKMFGYGRGATAKILKRYNVKPRTLSEALKGRIFTSEHKLNISKGHHDTSGKNNPMYGQSPKRGNTWVFAPCINRKMRSTWEVNIAQVLCDLGIKFTYESHRIYLGDISYLPDFHLTDFDIFLEVKGWYNAHFNEVLAAIPLYHPNLKLIILDQQYYPKVIQSPSYLLDLISRHS